MESPSQAPHSGGSPWKGLLLTAFILSCWIQSTSAQSVSVVPNPSYGTVGSSVVLDIWGFSEQPLSYNWYRREVDPSNQMAYYHVATGQLTVADSRMNIFSNGSLLISNLSLSDADNYTAQIINSLAQIQIVRGPLVVYGLLSTPTINSTNMAPVENKDTVSLTCQSNSQDVTDLVWFINQSSPVGDRIVLSPNNRTLTIINVTREDQGPYECEIWNPVSRNRSEPFTLNITYGPETPVIVPIDPNYPVGATLELSCSADSNPLAQYTWLFNGVQMISTPQLSIPDVSLNHTGTYTCIASNSVTGLSSSKDINITIFGLLSTPTINSTNMAPVENKDTVSLTCQSNSQDVTDVVWFINQSSPVGDRISLSPDNRTLTIISVTRENQGPYECEIWNPVSRNRSEPFTLNITYGPDTPVIVPIEPNYPVGATLVLSCSADSNPPAQYTWLFNGVERTSTPQLSIPDVSLNDTGTYTCNASNSVTGLSSSKDINVTISEIVSKPNITASSTNVLENTPLVITCNTEHQGINILWFFNNESLSLNERKYLSENNQTLNITNVRREDAGSYHCEVWNPISNNRSDPLTLTVNYGPDTITFSPNPEGDKIQVTINNPLTLVCQVESYPPAQYEWQVNGTVNSNFSDNTYTINSTSWEDSGSYTCLAWNNVTNISVSKVVTVSIVKQQSPGPNSLSPGAIVGIVIGVVAGVALIGGIIYFLFFRSVGGASERHLTEQKSSAPNNRQPYSESSPDRTKEVTYASVNFDAQKPTATAQPPTPKDTVYSEIKKK